MILLCTQSAPANDSVFETLLLASSLKRSGARSVKLYLSYSAYARQDKTVGPWRSLGYSDLATHYENSGIDKIVTLDIHNEAVMGCYGPKVHALNLTAVDHAPKYITEHAGLNNLVVLSPDEGGVKRAKKFFDCYQSFPGGVNADSKFIIMLKKRERPNEVAEMIVNGDVSGRDCILIDDMVDTGGTMIKAASLLKEKGAKKIFVFATHGIFNDNFDERLDASSIDKVFVSNSLPNRDGTIRSHKIERISVASIFADNIINSYEQLN